MWDKSFLQGIQTGAELGLKRKAAKVAKAEREAMQEYRKFKTKLDLQKLNISREEGKYTKMKSLMDIQGKAPKAWAWQEFQKYLADGKKPPPEILKALGMYLSPENLMMGEAMGFGGTLGDGTSGAGGTTPKMPKYNAKTEKLMYSPGQKKYFKVPK